MFTKFSRSHLYTAQKPQPLKQKKASPFAHLLHVFWTTYLPKQAGFSLNSCIKADSNLMRPQNLQVYCLQTSRTQVYHTHSCNLDLGSHNEKIEIKYPSTSIFSYILFKREECGNSNQREEEKP